MRTLTKLTLALGLVFGLGLAGIPGDASAAPTAAYTWIATTGTGTPGGPTIDANIGDTLTLQVDIVTGACPLDCTIQWSLSPTFDEEGNDVLDVAVIGATAIPGGWFELGGSATLTESTPGNPGLISSWTEPADLFGTGGPVANQVFAVGTIQFTVMNNGVSTIDWLAQGGAVAGSFVQDQNGLNNFLRGNVSSTATVNAPEPGTTALLGLGLLGLVLGGRRK